jgi:hypothetical protein
VISNKAKTLPKAEKCFALNWYHRMKNCGSGKSFEESQLMHSYKANTLIFTSLKFSFIQVR